MKGGMGSSNMASFVNQSVRKSWDPCLFTGGDPRIDLCSLERDQWEMGNPDLPSKPNCGSASVVSYDIVADVAVPKFDIRWKSVKMRENLYKYIYKSIYLSIYIYVYICLPI